MHFPQKYPAPRRRETTKSARHTLYPLRPATQPKSLLVESTKSARPTLHQRPPGQSPGTESPEEPPLRRSQPVGRAIGEIEAKDGLPSADRNNKATLLLTGPFRTAKSSAKDLTPLVLKLQYAKYHDALRAPWKNRLLRR